MKSVLLSTAAVALLASSALAQNLPVPPKVTPIPLATTAGGDAPDDVARFDLKFPGGKVKEFVAAVSKAVGKPVNVIIPKEGEATMIPAVEVSRVSVPSLFAALSNASQHQVAFPTSVMTSSPGVTNTSVQYKTVGFTFRTDEKNSPDAVWTFLATNPPEIPVAEPAAPPRVVQYYPVAEYLSHFSVEDITAAIESGWKLQGEATTPPATMRFHEETKLLIIAGTAAQMELIPQVLQGLSQMLRYPRSEDLPITRKAGQIIVPSIKFQDASVEESVDYIRRKTIEFDPDHLGFNIVVNETGTWPGKKVTLSLSNVPALEALKLIAEVAGMELEIRDHAIVLRDRPTTAAPQPAPGPIRPAVPQNAPPPRIRATPSNPLTQ